jgi:hypothetical protein
MLVTSSSSLTMFTDWLFNLTDVGGGLFKFKTPILSVNDIEA